MSRINRKDFVAVVGSLSAGAVLPGSAADAASVPSHEHHTSPSSTHRATAPVARSTGTDEPPYVYLTAPEAAFLEAAVARLIPADRLGPGAREAGVATFIDRQLAGTYGAAATTYVQGPFGDAPQPTQGYQLALTPRQIYRLGIAATDAACVGSDGKPFAQLAAQRQDAILSALEHGTLAFEELPAKTFFEMLLQNTVEGFFSDPIHGGNREMIGWKLVGFPGAAGAYVGAIEQHGKPFAQAPVSLAELEGHHH